MSKIWDIIESAKTDLEERFEYLVEAGDYHDGFEPHDIIYEVADSNVPIYNHDILQAAADDISLGTDEPELGPAFDGSPTPVNIIAANIYERIQQEMFEYWDELETQFVDWCDEMGDCFDWMYGIFEDVA